MRLLYYLSYIPTAPFWAVGWMLYGASWALTHIGNVIHDATTYRAWLVLHRRECERLQAQRSNLDKHTNHAHQIGSVLGGDLGQLM